MGIRGLTAFLKQGSLSSISDHVDMSADTGLPAQSHNASSSASPNHIVVIDGNAFSHWFCLEVLGSAPSLNTDYRLLKKRVVAWILKCHDTKVDCIFVFDGSTELDKLQCRLDRLCKQSANMNFALPQLPIHSSSTAVDTELNAVGTIGVSEDKNGTSSTGYTPRVNIQSTPPLLAISCIINSIGEVRDMGPRSCAFYAYGEADKTIVEVAVALKAKAIMSNDSDMLIYDTAGVGFIPFWGFGFANDGSLNAFIIRRRKVATLLGINERNLPLLAALVGNDFTSAETCYNIHKILFEGTGKLDMNKQSRKSQEYLSMDKLELSLSDMDEMLADGKRQRTSPKLIKKRSDSNLSASDRLKGRRRANRLEEENKRKVNHIKRSGSDLSLLLPTDSSKAVDTSDNIAALFRIEATCELRSSLEKEICPYGESALKTVRAAADFLKKAQTACSNSREDSLSAASTTAFLLGISEDDVKGYLAQADSVLCDKGDDQGKNTKVASLCVSISRSFEDNIQRYRVYPPSPFTPLSGIPLSVPLTTSGYRGPLSAEAGSVNQAVGEDEHYVSALRCCFRCYNCTPRCSDICDGLLSGMFTIPSLKSHNSTQSLDDCQSNLSCPLSVSPPELSESTVSSLPSLLSVNEGPVRLSPDMDQVLRYGMFIGRTPCSLLSRGSFRGSVQPSKSDDTRNNSHPLGPGLHDEDDEDGENGVGDLNEYNDGMGIRTDEAPAGEICCDSDYMLLQPLRRRMYTSLFVRDASTPSVPIGGVTPAAVIEIYKKNLSPYLERRNISITPIYPDLNTELRSTEGGDMVRYTVGGRRSLLLRGAIKLILNAPSSKLLDLINSPLSPLSSFTSSLRGICRYRKNTGRVGNQIFIYMLAVELYMDISIPEATVGGGMRDTKEHSFEEGPPPGIKEERTSALITAISLIISCTVTLIQSEVQLSGSDAKPSNGVYTDSRSVTGGKDISDVYPSSSQNIQNPSNTHDNHIVESMERIGGIESMEILVYDSRDGQNLNLEFVNTWTRIQLCLQHTNFAIEVAARRISLLQQHGWDGSKSGPKLGSEPGGELDGSRGEIGGGSAFLMLACGGDPGLLDPHMFSAVRTQLHGHIHAHLSAKRSRESRVDGKVIRNGARGVRCSEEVAMFSDAVRNILQMSSIRGNVPSNMLECTIELLQAAVATISTFQSK